MARSGNLRHQNVRYYFSLPRKTTMQNFADHLSTYNLRQWQVRDKLSHYFNLDGDEHIVGFATKLANNDFMYSEEVTVVSSDSFIYLYGHGNHDVFMTVCKFFIGQRL